MKMLENIKIAPKIVMLLALMGAITLFVAGFGSAKLVAKDAEYSQMVDKQAPVLLMQSRVHQRMTGMLYNAYQTIVYDGPSEQAQSAGKQEETDYRMAGANLDEAEKLLPGDPEIARVRSDLEKLHAVTLPASRLGMVNRNTEAAKVLSAGDIQDKIYSARIRGYLDAQVAAHARRSAMATVDTDGTSNMMWTIAIVALAAAIGLALYLIRSGITGPLNRLQQQMGEFAAGDYARQVIGDERKDEIGAMAKAVRVFRENGIAKQATDAALARAEVEQKQVVDTVSRNLAALSEGDLTADIKADFPPEYGALKVNFNEALARLRELIGSVSESASAITTGSGEIAQASEDLARRTESNAASLEETAASITQMDGRLKASATAATRTVERADQAIATVGGGRAVADEAVQAMGRVSDSAKGIDSVIEGLDKIAFQTRVLAMNAAVEAGRAGDAGRGFAVVADLVSALAMRAEEEAKRARDQLTLTQTDIVTAVEAVKKVDGALADISGDVTQVHELLATMASDNQAQSSAITQISAAIGTMDQSTQQNAAMVEETSAAARNLVSEVTALADQAGKFVVGGTPARRGTPNRAAVTQPGSYRSPVKALPAAAVPALTRAGADEWSDF